MNKQQVKVQLNNLQPKRFFTFGCSFTSYYWASWANILAYDLNQKGVTEFYNLGRSASDNFRISSTLIQAHRHFNFDHNDLIMVCWTNPNRLSNIIDNGWDLSGNLSNPREKYFSLVVKEFRKDFLSQERLEMQDFGLIYTHRELFKNKTNYLDFSICDFNMYFDLMIKNTNQTIIQNMFKDIFDDMPTDVITFLWDNDFTDKFKSVREINPKFNDPHPSILEYLKYVESVLGVNLLDKTRRVFENANNNFNKFVSGLDNNIDQLYSLSNNRSFIKFTGNTIPQNIMY